MSCHRRTNAKFRVYFLRLSHFERCGMPKSHVTPTMFALSSRVAPQNTTGEQELIRRTGCLHLGAFKFRGDAATTDAPRLNSETLCLTGHRRRIPRTAFQSRSNTPQTSCVFSRYFLLCTKIVVSRIRTNGCHALKLARHRPALAKEQHVASLRFHRMNLGQS